MDLGEAYSILGVAPGSTEQEIRAAYRDMVAVWHPDRFANNERLRRKAEAKLKLINEAYQTLGECPRSTWRPSSSSSHSQPGYTATPDEDSEDSKSASAEKASSAGDAREPSADDRKRNPKRSRRWLLVLPLVLVLVYAFHALSAVELARADTLLAAYGKDDGDPEKDSARNASVTSAMLAAAHGLDSRCAFVDTKIEFSPGDWGTNGTRLHVAAMNGHVAMAELLLLRGADPRAKTDEGETPMDFAAQFKHPKIMKLLKRFGCVPDAFQLAMVGDTAAVEKLVEARPILLSERDRYGRELLHCAALQGHMRLAGYLMKEGATVWTVSKLGYSPLHCAAMSRDNEHNEMAGLLLAAGEEVDETDTLGRTPLFYCALYECPHTAAVLIRHGANVNARDNYGQTILGFLYDNGDADSAIGKLIRRHGGHR